MSQQPDPFEQWSIELGSGEVGSEFEREKLRLLDLHAEFFEDAEADQSHRDTTIRKESGQGLYENMQLDPNFSEVMVKPGQIIFPRTEQDWGVINSMKSASEPDLVTVRANTYQSEDGATWRKSLGIIFSYHDKDTRHHRQAQQQIGIELSSDKEPIIYNVISRFFAKEPISHTGRRRPASQQDIKFLNELIEGAEPKYRASDSDKEET